MKTTYLVTGATSGIGMILIRKLLDRGETVRALALPNDPLRDRIPEGAEVFSGNVTQRDSMEDFFQAGKEDTLIVVHIAAIVTLDESYNPAVHNVNVEGTRNVLTLCREHPVSKLVYISSTSAIPQLPKGQVMTEVDHFDPELVRGCYAKSKAEASQLVLDAVREWNLNASIIHPTGLFGPYSYGRNNLIDVLIGVYNGTMTATVRGGADFIDNRDLADAIMRCCEAGRKGECYITGGQYYTLPEFIDCIKKVSGRGECRLVIPVWLCKLIAPLSEAWGRRKGEHPLLTRFSVYEMSCNMAYSSEKARKELGLHIRPLEDSMRDTIDFLRAEGKIQ
ncbi:MAG: NAD-dependent epimerase/dehydratase family protein [Faecousia sp.]